LGGWQLGAFGTQLTNLKSGFISQLCQYDEVWVEKYSVDG